MMRRVIAGQKGAASLNRSAVGGLSNGYQGYKGPGQKLFFDSRREYRVTRKNDSILIVGGLAVVVVGAGAQYALTAYESYQAKRVIAEAEAKDKESSSGGASGATKGKAEEASSPFSFTSTWFAKNFYDGGFDDKMTKREAALILGIRESASVDRIKEAYRKLIPINHPDRGGSPYITTKINEAKDLLLKGK